MGIGLTCKSNPGTRLIKRSSISGIIGDLCDIVSTSSQFSNNALITDNKIIRRLDHLAIHTVHIPTLDFNKVLLWYF